MLTFVLKFLSKKQQLYLALNLHLTPLFSFFLKTIENSNFQVYAKIPGFLHVGIMRGLEFKHEDASSGLG